MARRKEPRIPDAVLDQLLAGADPKTAFDPNGLLNELKKALAERALNAGMDHRLAGDEGGNSHNGYGRKTVLTETGKIALEVPRDRQLGVDEDLIHTLTLGLEPQDGVIWVYELDDDDGILAFTDQGIEEVRLLVAEHTEYIHRNPSKS